VEDAKEKISKRLQIHEKKKAVSDVKEIALRRVNVFEELQRRGYDIGYRERLCYLYWVHCQKAGDSFEKARDKTLEYNRKFEHPLKESFVIRECKPAPFIDSNGKQCEGYERKFKDQTILEFLGITETDLFKSESRKEVNRRYYEKQKQKKIDAGETKQQEIQARRELTLTLRALGKPWKEIADILEVSISTAKRYGADT
jgi:hypothetical protein